MRLTLSMIGLVGAVAALSACGGDRASAIAKAKSDCIASATKGGPAPGINAERACNCVVDAVSEGKTDAQVRDIFAQKDPPPEAVEAIGRCMMAEVKAAS